jgi:ribonuclease P protein component
VAFAIGTTVGGAVVRNRIRRRVRAALRGLLVVDRLPAGTYLIGATTETAQMPWSKLVATLSTTIDEVTR